MPIPDFDSVTAARTKVSRAAQERMRALAALATAIAERTKVAQRFGPSSSASEAAEMRYRAARKALETARGEELEANTLLRVSLAGFQEPREAIAALNPEYPILLFPVRLETRFVRFQERIERPPLPPQVGELWVRIYPDGILADSHEPLLSEVELAAGLDYWRTAWANAAEQNAWTALVAEAGATRAAWIVQQCRPTNSGSFPRSPAEARVAPAPEFPALETRPPNWHRTPAASLLPDRWVIQAHPNRAVTIEESLRYRVLSSPVIEPLALTLGFTTDGGIQNRARLADGLSVDPDIEWTFNFTRAVEVGMAVRIPLTSEDFEDGFYRLFALGVKASLGPDQSAQQLQELLDHHRVSRGLAFVPQGTPTNTTADASSGYPPPDPRATESFRVERGPSLAVNGADGALFMSALGVPVQTADHVSGADRNEQRLARAMAVALWPATIGYYLKQMWASAPDVPEQPADLSDETIEALRRHFVDVVRGRGPFPAFRIGDIPYGILPVSWMDPNPDPASAGLDATLPRLVSQLSQTLSFLAHEYAPHVGRTGDPDADLMETFRMDASAREVYVRPAVGEETIDNIGAFAGIDNTDRVHEPISLGAPIDLGGPAGPDGPTLAGLTLKTVLRFPENEPDRVAERQPVDRGGPIG